MHRPATKTPDLYNRRGRLEKADDGTYRGKDVYDNPISVSAKDHRLYTEHWSSARDDPRFSRKNMLADLETAANAGSLSFKTGKGELEVESMRSMSAYRVMGALYGFEVGQYRREKGGSTFKATVRRTNLDQPTPLKYGFEADYTFRQEMGHIIEPLYAHHLELRRLELVTKNDDGGRTAYFSPPKPGKQKNPSIYMTLASDEHYESSLTTRRRSVASFAERLGIKKEQMTVPLLKAYVFLHEVGHAHEYMTRYEKADDPIGSQKRAREVEMGSLPVPDLTPTQLEKKHGKESGIIAVQERAYRDLPSERYADRFAADFILKHISHLIGDSRQRPSP